MDPCFNHRIMMGLSCFCSMFQDWDHDWAVVAWLVFQHWDNYGIIMASGVGRWDTSWSIMASNVSKWDNHEIVNVGDVTILG